MRRSLSILVLALSCWLTSASSSPAGAAPPLTETASAAACSPAEVGRATCFARMVAPPVSDRGTPARPAGFSPATIKKVYGFSTASRAGSNQAIAIVVAYHHPDAESHLATFSTQFGLPQCSAFPGNPNNVNGCFVSVYAAGVQPPPDPGWAIEADLDVQWAHAIAPAAKIYLVEAASDGLADLFLATSLAAALPGVRYVNLSWGFSEFAGEALFEPFLQAPGVSYFASAGDSVGQFYPSTSPSVISVGGTTLTVKNSSRKSETAWVNTGGGCSSQMTAHPAQAAFFQYPQTGCAGARSTPDVAVVGDPLTGVSTYTTQFGTTGWYVIAGTSVSAPIIAAAAATTGRQIDATFFYSPRILFLTRFFDITTGQASCRRGFDTCSGRGSPTGWW